MELEFKTDFAHVREQWARFWRGELPRPAVAAVVPKPGLTPVAKPRYAAGHTGDFTPVLDQIEAWAATHDFIGEAIPYYYLEFSADQFATFLGCDLTFPSPDEGGWPTHPYASVPLNEVQIAFDAGSAWWQRVCDCVRQLMERFEGRLLIAGPTLVANLDALVALRGAETVLMDLIESPGEVVRCLRDITAAHGQVLDALAVLLKMDQWGSITRHGMYAPGRITVPQCDFSCMISPAMFREFVVPCLRAEMARLDAVEYHLDGPDAIRHVEALCETEALDVVQWMPGAGAQGRDWSDLYARIDALGKGLLLGGNGEQLRQAAARYRSRKIFWQLYASSRDEAEQYLATCDY